MLRLNKIFLSTVLVSLLSGIIGFNVPKILATAGIGLRIVSNATTTNQFQILATDATTTVFAVDGAGKTAISGGLTNAKSNNVKVETKSGDFTAGEAEVYIITSYASTVTLPDASTVPGRKYYFRALSTYPQILLTPSSGLIEGASTFYFNDFNSDVAFSNSNIIIAVEIVSDGASWLVVGVIKIENSVF